MAKAAPVTSKSAILARNAKIVAGIEKDLAKSGTIQLAGVKYNASSLAAVFENDSAAVTATEAAQKAASQAVLAEKATHAKTAIVLAALKRYLLAFYGTQAVTILGDFGMNAPASKATKTVTTKAIAVAKTKATRAARGTVGKVEKLATKGTVDTAAIEAAINDPSGSNAAATPAATGTAAGGAATSAPAATPAITAAPAATTKS